MGLPVPVWHRLYAPLAILALALLAAWVLGGSRALSRAVLVVAILIFLGGVASALRDRRRGEPASWSTTLLGGGLASLAIASEVTSLLAIPLLVAGVICFVLAERGVRQDIRQAETLLAEAERLLETHVEDKSK